MKLLLLLLALPLAAQTLSISCPSPAKNKPQICPITFTGIAASLQWKLVSSPVVNITATSTAAGKNIGSFNGTYLLVGMNATPLAGQVATITIPAHSGNVRLVLSDTIGSSATGHAVTVSPAVTVTVQ